MRREKRKFEVGDSLAGAIPKKTKLNNDEKTKPSMPGRKKLVVNAAMHSFLPSQAEQKNFQEARVSSQGPFFSPMTREKDSEISMTRPVNNVINEPMQDDFVNNSLVGQVMGGNSSEGIVTRRPGFFEQSSFKSIRNANERPIWSDEDMSCSSDSDDSSDGVRHDEKTQMPSFFTGQNQGSGLSDFVPSSGSLVRPASMIRPIARRAIEKEAEIRVDNSPNNLADDPMQGLIDGLMGMGFNHNPARSAFSSKS